MLKWFSGEEGESGSGGPGSPHRAAQGGEVAVEEMAERLTQTEQLVSQLKEMIREKDATLRSKDDQLKVGKEACEAKLSKLRLQNKAKVTSLTSQLEELKNQQGSPGTPTHTKKGSSETGDHANRGKIVLLKKKVEELEQQLAQKDEELENQRKEQEARWQRGEEMDAMLTERDKKLAEKEAYIVHLQSALAGDQPVSPAPQTAAADAGVMQELQLLVQSLTKKVGEGEERYSLLQEKTDTLKELLSSEKEQYTQKENMYKQNIQTFKDIIIQKDDQLMEMNQMHEQELFKLAAKSDASADLEQLLKALKQKLHEKEEVLRGKTQVIDVLQGEVDSRDEQIKELAERLRRLQVERESLESKMEAEKHVMRAQLRDLMEKQQAEVKRITEQHQVLMEQTRLDLQEQLEALRRSSAAAEEDSGSRNLPDDPTAVQRIAELEAQAKIKTDEASRSEAKFLKMKAWSKTRIRQLEEELKKSQAGGAPPDLTALRSRVTALEEEREENLWRVEQYEELQAKNEMLEAKLVVYEEQQRALQADLEQFTKRTASQASESGSADDTQSQVLEWQEMVAEAASARDRAREEKASMALRISHMEEEREALVTRQQELEEELGQARGSGRHRPKKLGSPARRSLQEDFEFDGQASFQDPRSASESTTPMEGENMGDGLRSLVEELELERNQLQEQILSLEERCQDLEDRVQLQARIEALQNETEKLHGQLASVRSQQSREAEKHQLVVTNLNEQLKGLSDTQECLESSLIEKENTLAKTSEKLELISSLQDSLSEKDIQHKELSEKFFQSEHALENISKKCSSSEKQCAELKAEVTALMQKLSSLKEKTLKQESTIETLQAELDQTNEELDKINSTHLEERAQLIHDLQSREREIDSLKDVLLEKDKEITALAGNMAEYAEQVAVLKRELKLKEESLVLVEAALSKAEREAMIIRDSQSSDQQSLNCKISEVVGKLKDAEEELVKAKEERESKAAEVEHLIKEVEEDKKTIQALRGDVQKQITSHLNHLSECESHIASLKEQLMATTQKLHKSETLISQLRDSNTNNEKLQQEFTAKEQTYEKELKSFKEEQNRLLSQVEKYNTEVGTLSKQLEEQVQSEQHIKVTIQEKLKAITTLESKLEANDELFKEERRRFNDELQLRDTENQKLSSELQSKSESVLQLKNLLKGIKTEKQQLQEKLKGLNQELDLQKQNMKELNEKAASAVELSGRLENQVDHLTEEKERLEVEMTERLTHISEVTAELESLRTKVSTLETQLSHHVKVVEGLQKDKEELTVQTSELNKVVEQNTNSNSEMLLVKTNECSNLSRLLGVKEEEVVQLNEQMQILQREVTEKEQIAVDLRAQIVIQQNQQAQLQEMVSLLQEQESGLKSGLVEKNAILKQKQEEYFSFQDELTTQKDIASKVQAEIEALDGELSQVKQQLVEREETLRNAAREQKEANETVKSLGDQIRIMEAGTKQLKSEAEHRQTELASLNSHIQVLTKENRQLQATCESREKEISEQRQAAFDLNELLKTTLEQNSTFSVTISSLTADNQRLQEESAQNSKSLSELTSVRDSLRERNSGLESQISDNQKTVSGLLQEKEELTFVSDELKKVLKESEQSNSAGLLQKANECAHLSKMLQQKDKLFHEQQNQVDDLKTQVGQLNTFLSDKEQMVSEQALQLEAQQNQLVQLQDTISMLQEQGAVLKSGLMEKDTMLKQKVEEFTVCQHEARQQLNLMSRMQEEVDSLQHKCSEIKQELEKKDEAFKKAADEIHSHREELNKRNESVMSLSSQLGHMNENAAEMETEIAKLNTSIQQLATENLRLVQEEDQRKAESIDFQDNIEALKEQNTRLKSELQNTVMEMSKAHQQVTSLKATVADRDQVLQATCSEKESVGLAMQGKDDALRQNEDLIQRLSSKITEQELQLKQRGDHNISLQTRVSELKGQFESLTSESVQLKIALEKKEQSSLEYQSHSTWTVENLNSHLQTKNAECESLKEHISHLEETVSKLNNAMQVSEVKNLKEALEEREAELSDQTRSLQDIQRSADEASLFKTQFMESTEMVSQLQSQIQQLSAESGNLRKSAEETQSAFNNLQDKYAANLEELQNVRQQLSQKTEEVSNLGTSLDGSSHAHHTAQTTIETLRRELSEIRQKLEKSEVLNSSLSKEKEEAFASHQANVSQLTIEIDRLKLQHLQVAAQMNALGENLEQREMALHAINSQYAAQAKHASQLVSEMQKLEEQNKRLTDELSLSKEENQKLHAASRNENTHLQQEFRTLVGEKEDLERRYHQIRASQEELQLHMEQKSSSMSQIMEQMASEKQNLQAKVSAKDQDISQLEENMKKIEQILQDSEKEWLLVLDREKQDKNLLAEQLKSVENEMKSKDVKVNALKQDLDHLQNKLAEASSAIRLGSDQLSAKESEASASRIQLEKVLASIQEKDSENVKLRQYLKAVENELGEVLVIKKERSSSGIPPSLVEAAASNKEKVSLRDMMRALKEHHQSEVDSLRSELAETVAHLQNTQNSLEKGVISNDEKGHQVALLQNSIEHLQTLLHAEVDNMKEAAVKHSCLLSELAAKDKRINCMNIQISQQKELLAGLSQQLKDKDASIVQVMESASNERVKLGEENSSLLVQLESVEQAHKTTTKKLEQLEEQFTRSQREIETLNVEKQDLVKERANLQGEVAKASKERDVIKKKLQAALVVRKDLLKRINEYENQKEESVNSKTEVSQLQDKLQEITNQAEAADELFKESVSLFEKKLLDKESEILEFRTQSERLVEQLKSEKEMLRSALHEAEVHLCDVSQTVSDKESFIKQLQSSAAEKESAFERDRGHLMLKVEELQDELKICREKPSSGASALDLENELAQLKSEKATLQKKAQAALLARKETLKKAQEGEKKLTQELAELKDDYKALLEQHCQQTNELNAVQLEAGEKTRELEGLHKTSLAYLDELETLRQLVDERDKAIQFLKMSLAEKESQCHSLTNLQTELETVKSRLENICFEMLSKDEALVVMRQTAEALKSKINALESDLEKAHAEVWIKTEEVRNNQGIIKDVEVKAQQENQALLSRNVALENELNVSSSALEEQKQRNKQEKAALLEQSNRLKVELNTAAILLSQKSSEVLSIQKTLAETQQQLNQGKDVLTKELEKVQLHYVDTQKRFDSLKHEKEKADRLIGELSHEVTTLSRELKESEQLREINTTTEVTLESESQVQVQSSQKCPENFEEKLKESETALSASQAQVLDKERLIAALELQLQQQIKTHEAAVDRMRIESEELRKSQEDGTRVNDQSKISLLTRKLQAALVSRKDLMNESAALKEEIEKLSSGNQAKKAECFALGTSVSKLKQENLDLKSSVSAATSEKQRLSDEVDRVLNDNGSLSAACESLKLTIENITQQKQTFSCQLESLKDSQTEELSKWKSKHTEIKQEYESLLEAYENVSSEMDKMRQLLEGAKRERQEALRKTHKHEAEKQVLEKQVREMEEENQKMKERMLTLSKDEQQKIKELEEENQNIKKELTELDVKHKISMSELRNKNQQLEAEIHQLKESSDALRIKLTETQAENSKLAEKILEASTSLEKKDFDSNTYTNNMQLKFDEALNLNNSLTAQIKAQKTELGAQMEINDFLQKEKQNLSERIEKIMNEHELHLGKKDEAIKELEDVISTHSQETINLNEKVRILEDDKSLLQEELENVQEISDKVKNENEYLETLILKNSERIDELTESLSILQTQNSQLSAQLAASKEMSDRVRQEKELEQLKLVRELEEKLKTVQRGSEGTKNFKKELQELLKEKHQEINQLQQNCIKYQELILDLESSLKSSQSACELLEKDLKKSSGKISTLEEKRKQAEDELMTNTSLMREAEEKVESIKAERDQLALQVAQNAKHTAAVENTKSLQSVDESQTNPNVENQFVLQQQLEDLKNLKDKESQKVEELHQQLDSQHLQIQTLKRAVESSQAKLSALSATPQGEDASKLWNELYQKTLQEKDNQLLEQGFMIKRFLEDMRVKDKEVNELRVTKSRLERTLNEYSVAAAAQQRQLFVMSASNAELSETAELSTVQVKELDTELERIEQDKNALIRQLADKDDAISQMQLRLQQVEKMNADTDSQLQLTQAENDQIRANFEKQEGISLQLKTLLRSKDAEISSLLSCKEGQMSGYLEQLQTNYRTQVSLYEDRLTSLRYQREKAEKESRGLEAKVKSLQIKVNRSVQEKEQMAAKMESFKNSMVSLQSERERLLSQYRILEAKTQLGLRGKEGFADNEGGATKGLKHEIRKLLHQMDDLNSENAMLRAQLVRYREDLNQVLSLKDNQLKVLLKKQQDVIKNLEVQKAAVEKQHRESRLEYQREEETSNVLKAENSKLKSRVSKLEAEVLTQRKERAATQEGKVIVDLQDAVAAKAAECHDLQQKLLSHRISLDELRGKMQQLENETDKKLSEAEDRYNSELDAFEREVEVMRGERESTDQRVAELARDLLEMEQQLSAAKSQSNDCRTQNESLCKAMAALQNDRDQLIKDFKVLRNRYDEELRETQAALNKVERSLQDTTSDLAMFAKERDILAHKVKALESKDPPTELSKLLDELSKALSEKERELKKSWLENDGCGRQLSAFSRSMASLQNDRDRLMDELLEAKRVAQSGQGASPGGVTGASVETLKSSSVGANQSEADGPMTKQTGEELQQKHKETREETVNVRSEAGRKNSPPVQEAVGVWPRGEQEELVKRLNAERVQLHGDLQRCLYELQQRDQHLQQLSTQLQQAAEDKAALGAQLRTVSQTLRDSQSRCHWLEAQGSVLTQEAPGAPQERSSDSPLAAALRERLVEAELNLSQERARREAAEEALRLAEAPEKSAASSLTRDAQRDFSIDMEPEDEWDALSLDPGQPLITRQVRGGMAACRRWLRGRSLYFSRLLTGRARSRYFFLAYLLTIHVLVLLFLAGAL